MSLRHGTWVVEHPLPLGLGERAVVGQSVALGATLGAGTVVRGAVRVSCARRLGIQPADLGRVLRVEVGALITKGSVLARIGRRFPRAVTAPFDGRLVHVSAVGDLWLAPVVERWLVRSTMAGQVVRATDAAVTVEGSAWSVRAMAAYGPDAIGTLAMGVAGPAEELSPHGLDVRLRGVETSGVDLRALARASELFTGADLRATVERALDDVIETVLDTGEEIPVGQQHLTSALAQVTPSALDWLARARDYVEFSNASGQWTDVESYLGQRAVRRRLTGR